MGLIDEKYAWLLANSLNLGPPLADEQASVDGIGSKRSYEFGTIFLQPSIGAFEVHGAILAKYVELGSEQSIFGYPVSDELDLPDGSGRYSQFEFGIIAWKPSGDLTVTQAGSTANCLIQLPLPTGWLTPARDLTRLEARDIVVYLISQGAFTLKSWSPLQFDAQCRILSPQPSTRIAIEPATIGGVQFINDANPAANYLDNLDMRMVVGLYRLASFLSSTFGVSQIRHKGIGHGGGGANDCHNTGRALDLSGVAGTFPLGVNIPGLTGVFAVDVLQDWGNQPVPVAGADNHTWPTNFSNTTYRLNPIITPIPFVLFQSIYNFASTEFVDNNPARFGNTLPPTQIGVQSRFIIHPDHPSGKPGMRPKHQDHVHMQIGPTGL